MNFTKTTVFFFIVALISSTSLFAQSVKTAVKRKENITLFSLTNNKIQQRVLIKNGVLAGDELLGNTQWLNAHHNKEIHNVSTDADFSINMMWTDWTAPNRQVHANTEISFDKKNFRYQTYNVKNIPDGKQVALFFSSRNPKNTLQLKITYQLLEGKFYARRRIAVRDTIRGSNWLKFYLSRTGKVSSKLATHYDITKKGAFGQPAAVDFSNGGVFFGIEYPAATTTISREDKQSANLKCREIVGTVVKDEWVSSKWVVEGLVPNHYIKNWFYENYIPDIRYTNNEPYALYNSWYDLRSPAFKDVAKNHIMNEKNIMTIIHDFKKNMIEPYDIHLDAFVLDDGWDIHKSDWKLDPETFPNGLKSISNALDKLGTTLGIWYGPTGGYSFRNDRINWMKAHGYEVVKGQRNRPMLCIGGKKYSALFEKRTTDMVKNGGVGYFKWDGLQFSCSNPTHGHPIGEYSRRALLDSLIAECKAVRRMNPDVYLNITSGTWLSPWWMMYANQIWMQGGDYGFADVPSYSQRDASMTYKDLVLYNDFHNLNQWFPLSNLMTHGIIKGRLNEIGGKDDPLNKFTDDAMFYFGRGVTMYELYISPDLLDAGEWNALSKSLKWAEDRFSVINNNTFMIGGQPAKGEAYGYVHYKGTKGIVALRNPGMEAQHIDVKLDPAHGMNPAASSLVLERVYPNHWIAPHLYAAGATVTLPLKGYESAIYEVYPVDSARRPLLAGVTFKEHENKGNAYQIDILKPIGNIHLLNPQRVTSVKVNGEERTPLDLKIPLLNRKRFHHFTTSFNGDNLKVKLKFGDEIKLPRLVVMLHPDSIYRGEALPKGALALDGESVKPTIQEQDGVWSVYSYQLDDKNVSGKHVFNFDIERNGETNEWKGMVEVWLVSQKKIQPISVSMTTKNKIDEQSMPPSPYEKDAVSMQVKLGEGAISL